MSRFIKTGVIGHPVGHSKSPLIHNHWIEKYALTGHYEALDIHPDLLRERLPELLFEEGYAGFNLTIPHKEIALDICDEIDDTAHKIGAVNTVWKQGGKICGSNTDAYGFAQNLGTVPDGPALVLGAGGAAKAILYALQQAGCTDMRITNRTREKAKNLAQQFDAQSIDWSDRHTALDECELLVNTTALGMTGHVALELDLDKLPQSALVCDIVYNPLMTDLLTRAQKRGNPVITGIGMLLHQARPAFEKWYGVLPDIDEELMRKVLA
jgi:shikimate dehydrogenase